MVYLGEFSKRGGAPGHRFAKHRLQWLSHARTAGQQQSLSLNLGRLARFSAASEREHEERREGEAWLFQEGRVSGVARPGGSERGKMLRPEAQGSQLREKQDSLQNKTET